MRSIEDLLADPAEWPVVADLVRSGQLGADRMAQIARDFPEFWSWFEGQNTVTH